MKPVIFFMMLCGAVVYAENETYPSHSSKSQEGKILYSLPAPPVDLNEEIRIQKKDQNSTGHRGKQ